MHHKIVVSNVKCEGCAANIQGALAKVPEVSAVSVDVPSGTVEFDAEATVLTSVTTSLAAAGYPVAGKSPAKKSGLLGLFSGRN